MNDKEIAAAFGRIGGKARAKKLSKAARSRIARAAVKARWDKYRKNHPKPKI